MSRRTTVLRRALAAIGVGALAASALTLVAPAEQATAATQQFRGVNWADPADNYNNGVVVPSGLSTSDGYDTIAAKSAGIIDGFAALGANTVRLPVNPSSVGTSWWNSYTGAIDTATKKGFKVILGYWEGTPQDGRVDDTAVWYAMWDTIAAKYASNANVYFEPANEPFGYSSTDWGNLAAAWLQRYTSVPQSRVLIAGVGYDQDAKPLCGDSRFANVLFAIHDYGFWANHDYAGWVSTLESAVGNCASRSVLDEFGAPMTTGIDYDAGSSGHSASDDNFIAYIQAMVTTTRRLGMGSVYWPGLRTGDTYSLTTLAGSGTNLSLTLNSRSGLDRLRDAWGIGATQLVGQASGRCIDDAGFSTSANAPLSLYDCNGGGNQRWTATGGTLVGYAGLCLDVRGGGTASGTAVGLYTCNGGSNQQWTLKSDGTIVANRSGLCLDVSNASTANGASIGLWTCNGGGNQRWSTV